MQGTAWLGYFTITYLRHITTTFKAVEGTTCLEVGCYTDRDALPLFIIN